jgi:hypothetical protein
MLLPCQACGGSACTPAEPGLLAETAATAEGAEGVLCRAAAPAPGSAQLPAGCIAARAALLLPLVRLPPLERLSTPPGAGCGCCGELAAAPANCRGR